MKYSEVAEWAKETLRPKRIVVCTAWGSPFCWTMPTYNMANLVRPEGVEVIYLPGFGWCPARRHNYGVERALELKATHMCFLGADQMHPLDILLKFTKHIENGWAGACARVPARGHAAPDYCDKPFQEIAFKWREHEDPGKDCREFSNECIELIDEKDGPYQQVASIGTGAIMFDMNLIKGMKKPWFREYVLDDGRFQRQPVMDTSFVYRLVNERGARIVCDLTIKVQHVDAFPIDASWGDKFEKVPTWNLLSK